MEAEAIVVAVSGGIIGMLFLGVLIHFAVKQHENGVCHTQSGRAFTASNTNKKATADNHCRWGDHKDMCEERKDERNDSASDSNELLCGNQEVSSESILDAVKLIAALKPESVKPFSLGNVGGVKIISSPYVPEGSIIVSDDIYLLLQKLSNT